MRDYLNLFKIYRSLERIKYEWKKEISFEIYSDSEEMLEQIVDKYDLPDKSKALRCLMDYVEEKETEWDEMFATIRCNRCG